MRTATEKEGYKKKTRVQANTNSTSRLRTPHARASPSHIAFALLGNRPNDRDLLAREARESQVLHISARKHSHIGVMIILKHSFFPFLGFLLLITSTLAPSTTVPSRRNSGSCSSVVKWSQKVSG